MNRYGRLYQGLRAPDPHDVWHRWSLQARDREARPITLRLAKAWDHWTTSQRGLLLSTAEAIAKAELAKRAWNPKGSRIRHKQLCKVGVTAAQLANEIGTLFPPPWSEEYKAVQDLVARLGGFAVDILEVTAIADQDMAWGFAALMLQELKDATPRHHGRASWVLLRDLIWLASGKRITCSERTIRRYLTKRKRSPTPADAVWRRHFSHVRNASLLTPGRERHSVVPIAKKYLLESS